MKTEAEASQTWCPFARVGNEAGCNRNGNDAPLHPFCIGSACMAWQWTSEPASGASRIEAIRAHRDKHGTSLMEAKDWVEAHPEEWSVQSERGYCGLVDKP